jgi:hypothetical protein
MGWAELGSHVEFNGRHYALVGSFNSGLGRRFDPVYNTSGKAGGMYVMMSEHIEGPYVLVDGDPLLLGCRNAPANFAYVPAYYSRTFLLDDEIMIHHHWMPRENFTDAWLGTCKVLREDRPGKLSIHWWSGNEALKGNTLFSIVDRPSFTLPESFDTPTGSWRYGDDGLELESESSVLAYCETQDLSMGVVVEADLRIDGNGAGGLFFGNRLLEEKHPFEGDAFLCNTRGYAEFGMITFGHCSPTFMPENNVLYTIPKGRTFHVRLLARGEFVEAYIDDRLVQCYGFSKPIYRNIGLFAENCRLTVKQLQVFEFSILASSPPRVDEA